VRKKSSERRSKAGKVLEKSAGAKGEKGNLFFDSQVEEALKGETQERWELKEAS
jgi:hypothetical protein